MRSLFALLAALLLAAPAHAQSQDSDKVFDDLFGTEPARVTGTRGPRAGRDDLTIVALHLGRYQLVESLPAYTTPTGLCLPLLPVLEALELGHAEADGQQVIELHAPERRVPVPAEALTPSPEGPCLARQRFPGCCRSRCVMTKPICASTWRPASRCRSSPGSTERSAARGR